MTASECRTIFNDLGPIFRTDRQVFFVFDTEFCQNEEDDPKDAIVYFYPHDTTDNVRCTLCCQLMGMCRFMSSCFSPISLIRLGKGKFAIRTIKTFTLGLKGNPDMPDSVLHRQLSTLIQLFYFYYKDFDAFRISVGGSRSNFVAQMTSVWSQLLAITQHAGNTLSLTFDVIPSIELPKTAGLLFLQTSQLLQACQRYLGVYAGCFFCDRRVLFSQLSTSILGKLSFIWQKQRVPGEQLKISFDLPGGVTLVSVYLTQKERHDLDLISPYGEFAKRRSVRSWESGSSAEDFSNETTFFHNSGETSGRLSAFSLSSDVNLRSSEDSSTKSCTDESYRPSSVETTLTETSVDEILDEIPNLQPKILYIQEYNDTFLVLILDPYCQHNPDIIHGLWSLCSAPIMSLETDVRACFDAQPQAADQPELKYLYLQFDKIWQKAQGNIVSSKVYSLEHQVFNQNAQLLHEDFVKEPQLYETTIRIQDMVIYSHVLGSKETYFYAHTHKPSPTSSGNSSKRVITGFPLKVDSTADISTKAKRKLLKEHRLVLL